MGTSGPLAVLLLALCGGVFGQLINLDEVLGGDEAIGGDIQCTITIEAEEEESGNSNDPLIKGKAECGGETLYDETRPLSQLEPVQLTTGISLFEEHGDMGYAYLSITGNEHMTCNDCKFIGLPAFPKSKGGSEAAVIVNNPGHTTFKKLVMYLLEGGYKSVGGIIFEGKSLATVIGATFQECHGVKAGVMEVVDSAVITITRSVFEKNTGEVNAGSMFIRSRGKVTISGTKINGVPAPEEFSTYVLGDKDSLPEDLVVVDAGAISVIENGNLDLRIAEVRNCWGKTGAIHTTHDSFLDISFSRLENNTGLSGGAVLVEGLQGHNAKMHDTQIVSNTAREGGALFVLGEGNMYVNQTEIQANTARIGGGFYSDFSAPGEEEYVTCGKATEGSRMSFNVVKFIDNVAETSGGGIHAKCSLVRMRNITVTDNSAGEFGGGIFVDTVADLDFEFAPFEGNKAGLGGSAIYAVGSILVDLEDCDFKDNEVESIDFGGTVMIDGTEDLVMKRVRMESNTVGGSGGALWLEGAETMSLESIYLYNNSAADRGGAIYGSGVTETVDLSNVTLLQNSAGTDGGGVVIDNAGDVALSTVTATNNSAGLNGGGVAIHGSGDFSATDVVAEDNVARNDCGGLRAAGFETIELVEVTASGNAAAGNGGGLCFNDIGTMALDETVRVDSNTAGEEGGGIHIVGASGPISIAKSSIRGNAASIGVVTSINNCTTVSLTDLAFLDNSASFSCGAIQATSMELLQIENVEFSRNEAMDENGGAMCLDDIGSILLSGATSFTNNSAGRIGGAIYVTKATEFDSGSTKFYQNSAVDGGAIGGTDVLEFSSIGGNYSNNRGQGNGGGIYLNPIDNFILEDVVFMSNHAGDGGGVRITNGSSVDFTNVTFSRNTASGNGGGIMVDHFSRMDLTNVNITNNTAQSDGAGVASNEIKALKLLNTAFDYNTAFTGRGGALHLFATNVDGDNVHLNKNEAYRSGGAFLCEGNSSISMKNINFTYNFARAGQSLSAYCGCFVNVSDSEFHREKHRKHNGGFFEKKKSCADIIHNNCLFFGAPDAKLAGWVIAIIVVVGVLVLFCCILVVALVYYRKKYGKKLEDEEDPIKNGHDDDETSEEYTTTDEESEESIPDKDEAPRSPHKVETKPAEAPQENNPTVETPS